MAENTVSFYFGGEMFAVFSQSSGNLVSTRKHGLIAAVDIVAPETAAKGGEGFLFVFVSCISTVFLADTRGRWMF